MCRSKASKIILMMSKIFKKIHSNKIKKIMKIQEKTQDMQEPKKNIKINIKRIFQRKDWIAQFVQKNFSKKNLLPEFLLSNNQLP